MATNHWLRNCTRCDADWVRLAADPLHVDERCLLCDGLLVAVAAPAKPAVGIFSRLWRRISAA